MSDYGPPTDDQIRQFHGSQARVARWVQENAVPDYVAPPPSMQSYNSSSRSSSRNSSLPPPPPGFKYAPANTPVVFKTQAATYTVVHPSTKSGYSSERSSSRSSSRSHSSSTPQRQYTYPTVTYQTPYQTYQTQTPAYYYQAAPRSKPREKEQPLFRRLFGVNDVSGQKKPDTPRRHSTGSGDTKITIQW